MGKPGLTETEKRAVNDNAELAAQLRDIHLPAPPAWWPPQPGWWLIGGALLAVGLWLILRLPAWKREALARLRAVERAYAGPGDAARLLAEVSMLLRSCALLLKGRRQVAGLTGGPWLDCLRELGRGRSPAPDELLLDGAYRRNVDLDGRALARSVGAWIRRARNPAGRAS